MPDRRDDDGGAAAVDRISALPDDILHLLLSFMPSVDAVGTSPAATKRKRSR